MTFETCIESRNNTLMQLFGTPDTHPIPLASGTIGVDGRSLSTVLQDLPVCDLQKELDNVLYIYVIRIAISIFKVYYISLFRRLQEQDWLLSSVQKLSISSLWLHYGPSSSF